MTETHRFPPRHKIHVRYGSGHYQLIGIPQRLCEQYKAFAELSLARGIAPRTVRSYAFDLAIYFRFRDPARHPFKHANQKDLELFILAQKKAKAAPASINRRLNSVESFYRYSWGCNIPPRTGLAPPLKPTELQSDTRRGIRFLGYDSRLGIFPIRSQGRRRLRVRVPATQIRPLTPPEVQRFMGVLQTDRDRLMALLMLFCGLRQSEVLELKRSNLQRATGEIRVLGKGRKERVLPVAPVVWSWLDRYTAYERPDRELDGASDRIFLNLNGPKRGGPLSTEGLRSVFRTARKASGVRQAHPHRFRHTFAANLAGQGVSLHVLQKLLGHSDPRTSCRYISLFSPHLHSEYHRAITFTQKDYANILPSDVPAAI